MPVHVLDPAIGLILLHSVHIVLRCRDLHIYKVQQVFLNSAASPVIIGHGIGLTFLCAFGLYHCLAVYQIIAVHTAEIVRNSVFRLRQKGKQLNGPSRILAVLGNFRSGPAAGSGRRDNGLFSAVSLDMAHVHHHRFTVGIEQIGLSV